MLTNLTEDELITRAYHSGEGKLTNSGVLSVLTGKCTGRSPHAKAVVREECTEKWLDWSANQSISPTEFSAIHKKIKAYFKNDVKNHYVQIVYANHDPDSRLDIQVHTTTAWQSHYARNMFNVPKKNMSLDPQWTLYCAPEYSETPQVLISFGQKTIIIVGTHYAGEIKKSVFTVLNFLLPLKGILPMHCAVNTNVTDTRPAIFFGLSGTGKTTLSSDTSRILIGDDEHCWSEKGLYNFEGGCYAKTYMLNPKDEPDIWTACHKRRTILENVVLDTNGAPDFNDNKYTENARASYPINHVANADPIGWCHHPTNVVMLTCDAFGVLPPVSRLNYEDAVKHFLLGYTAKVSGTELGVTEPSETFSYCYGSPFMLHRPTVYSNLLLEKIKTHKVNCWLVNTGWSGGPYGTGKRMPIELTRDIIKAIHSGTLINSHFSKHRFTHLDVPSQMDDIDSNVLKPENTWKDKDAYKLSADILLKKFDRQYEKMGLAL